MRRVSGKHVTVVVFSLFDMSIEHEIDDDFIVIATLSIE